MSGNNLGIYDPEQHTITSFAWNTPIRNIVIDLSCDGSGACAVQPAVTADGTFYRFSGKYKLCTIKNGFYYHVDADVTPDLTISKVSHFCDRKWLIKYFRSLP